MRIKAPLLLAALLAFPAVAIAQTPPPAPSVGGPTAPTAPSGQHMRHHMTWSPADVAKLSAIVEKMKAQMAKAEAAHKATRAKILAALTPAHKAYLANLIGQLAVAANPDPKAATAKLDSILTASEKSKILALHSAAMAQMMSQMKSMMPPMAGGDRHVEVFMSDNAPGMMKRTHHTMTAGEILMHLAGGPHEMGGPMMGAPMMFRTESFGHGPMQWRHPHPMAPLTPPLAPVAPVTPAPQATP